MGCVSDGRSVDYAKSADQRKLIAFAGTGREVLDLQGGHHGAASLGVWMAGYLRERVRRVSTLWNAYGRIKRRPALRFGKRPADGRCVGCLYRDRCDLPRR